MINFSQIITERKNTLERDMKYRPLSELKENIRGTKIRADFKKALLNKDDVSVICEYKPASPSKGDISNLLVEDVVPIYDKGGASAISVLTEQTFFKSSIKNLRIASKVSKLPLLRKDFVMDEYQIYEARSCGASAVLLMASVYKDLRFGIDLCHYLEMDALVECKNRGEIEMAVKAGAEIIGINNRDFSDFSIDFKRTEKLAKYIPENKVLVSESGVKNSEDVKLLGNYGADAVLIGSTIMESNNMLGIVQELVKAGKNVKVS
ncbi:MULTISPECIES: indole-3-glycerol phosphate synthase TrpC [Methanobacterium]|jgi:indole-3-glycerol phosphate synthase|uniref:Indole-3-glycerol phosphate synthase n=1 Tax=Methanobacterium veterum TaxID=408577 RepID=A0A9E5A0I8_9EURY|nr:MULTISPECIES: indole-3-glycerol phosphate synthase TrpC [Methanobacterium]MCZ3364491.1 indole-3-glycerol phosphate synthase TrpC [Methanobacterium veterum]MCZ3372244.1 indole-3-glycerol phosphate synthase TrpC [Methanobacterium veterum]